MDGGLLIIGNGISFVAAIFMVASCVVKRKRTIFLCQFLECALLAVASVFFGALAGAMTQKQLLEKKPDWKVSSVSNTVRMLHSIGLLDCKVENGNIIYFVNENFRADDYLNKKNA